MTPSDGDRMSQPQPESGDDHDGHGRRRQHRPPPVALQVVGPEHGRDPRGQQIAELAGQHLALALHCRLRRQRLLILHGLRRVIHDFGHVAK